jgi:hypothetical protein
MFTAEAGNFFDVGPMKSGNGGAGDGAGRSRVRFRDVAAAGEADVESHEKFLGVSFKL